ncbi:MAG: PSD1 and planctomycete cytochrome C domain-containing protein [Phycisphaerales bacterium]|nr:PSD1 and planctomycete cytochrome C domain-containing protein [Phycisphaerales bacterium]
MGRPKTVLLFVLTATVMAAASSAQTIEYGRDIRPILSDRCFPCHGPDEAARKARLRLDTFEYATAERRRGKVAIAAGDSERSQVWHRISTNDPLDQMPPPDSGKAPLTKDEQRLIRLWIEQGAPYQTHWSFSSLQTPPIPVVHDPTWSRTPVDYFVLADHEQAGTLPTPEVDPATLCRRIYLDLTGLPPSVEELDAFLADQAPDAYEQMVDRLLSREPWRTRYAEHMATPWLDLARYADTIGIHTDAGRSIWLWRDWVIHAFRDNMPLDQFIIEQLAGDLIPEATTEQKIASGFNRCHVISDEGGAIDDELLFTYAVDRTNTYGTAFLGLTVGCAQCHDHKYDPFTMEDYYGLLAFFNSNNEPGLYSQLPNPIRAHEPELQIISDEQSDELAQLKAHVEQLTADQSTHTLEESNQLTAFRDELHQSGGWNWSTPPISTAKSRHGATLSMQEDHSILASGDNPDVDSYDITMHTDRTNLRALLLEVMQHESLPHGRAGRAGNGNMILSGIEAKAVSTVDPSMSIPIRFHWAWADIEQSNEDYQVTGALNPDNGKMWAIDAHRQSADRVALFLADAPFGFEGGTELTVTLHFHSPYPQHAPGHVRLSFGSAKDSDLSRLPMAASGWYIVGPFATKDGDEAYETVFGPESSTPIDYEARYRGQTWRYAPGVKEDELVTLAQGVGAEFVARELYAPTPRTLQFAMGSDDGLQVYHNGRLVHENRIDRGVARDQDQFTIDVPAGRSTMVCKFVNTGAQGGMFHRLELPDRELRGDVLAMVLPKRSVPEHLSARATAAWRLAYSPRYRALNEQITEAEGAQETILASAPRTMVMEELPEARATYVMRRGHYDDPDLERMVDRNVPGVLGRLQSGDHNRLDLAEWTVGNDNPITARVFVNRLWQQVFGAGLAETVEDLGMQGSWPRNRALLDWLAADLRTDWDLQRTLRHIVLSATYRQASSANGDAGLRAYPRQRLGAEQIRDQALFVSGLLVEKTGGVSVKPYQPDGLWQEVAMPQSNTRTFEQGSGDDLWRRSLYTYWKRAAPPPSLMTFDAPTREFCTARRIATNTPLQALVLWNDPQFVETARGAAVQAMQASTNDQERAMFLYRACTGKTPSAEVANAMTSAVAHWHQRYAEAPNDAQALLAVGESSIGKNVDPAQLAAWTMAASGVLSSDAAIVKD